MRFCPNPRKRDPRLAVIVAAGFAAFVNLYSTQSLLPVLRQVFHASAAVAGLTISAATLAVALSAPLAGVIVERVPRRQLFIGTMLGLVLTALLCATSHTLGVLICWRFVQGLMLPPLLALTLTYIGEEYPSAQVGPIMALYVAANVVGGFTGRFVSGLVAAHAGWRVALAALALLNVAGAVVLLRSLAASETYTPPGERSAAAERSDLRRRPRSPLAPLANPALHPAFLAGFNVLFSLVALFTYVTYYLSAPPFNLGPAALGSLFCVYLVGVFVTPMAGRLLPRVGYRAAIMGATAMAALGAFLTLGHGLAWVIAGLAVCSSAAFVSQSAATGYVSEVAGDERSSALGLYLSAYYLGGSAGAVVPALAWWAGGWWGTVLLLLAVHGVTYRCASRLRDLRTSAGRPACQPTS